MMIVTLIISGVVFFVLDYDYNRNSNSIEKLDRERSSNWRELVIQNIVRLGKKGLLEKKESVSSSIHKSFIVFTVEIPRKQCETIDDKGDDNNENLMIARIAHDHKKESKQMLMFGFYFHKGIPVINLN